MQHANHLHHLALAQLLFTIAVATSGCIGYGLTDEDMPPIFVSIVIHNEESADYVNDVTRFDQERSRLVVFANMLHDNQVMLNWQSDWTFLKAVPLHDTGDATGGYNIVQYLVSLGFEVDPHAHESQYNYADVAYLISECSVNPSGIAGGFIADPPQNSLLEQFWQPIRGAVYPQCSWEAQALWGGGTSGHVNEESLWASGIWKPEDNENFMAHDENAPVPHIGKYGNTWADLDSLIQLQQNGQLDKDALYTAAVFVRQVDLLGPNFIANFEQDLQNCIGTGYLEWVGLSELIETWEIDYHANPNQLAY